MHAVGPQPRELPGLPIGLNARCYSTVVSPTTNTNPKLMAFVLFGKHRTEGGVTARIKIRRLPKKFHKLLGNEMSSNARSAFQRDNYWHFPLTQGTGRLSLSHSLMPLTTHFPKSLLLLLASDTISQYTSAATGILLEELLAPAEGRWESLPLALGVLIPTRVFHSLLFHMNLNRQVYIKGRNSI